jgi:hypothetical protein
MIHPHAVDDKIRAANDPIAPNKTTRSEEEEHLDQDEKPSPSTIPRRKRCRPRKDDADNQNQYVIHVLRCPRTAPTAAASPYHRLRQVRSGTRTARHRRCCRPWSVPRVSRPRYDLRGHRRRSHSCIYPTTQQTQAIATNHTARYIQPLLNCLPSYPFPPREISRHSFF